MDLFIIIAAVLAAGGVVATSVSGLIGSSASQSNVSLTGISIASAGNSLSLTLKNTGTSALTIGSSVTIAISGLSASTTGTSTCPAPTSFAGTSSVSWTVATNLATCATVGTVTTVKYTGPASNPPSLLPGQQLSFTANPVLNVNTFSSGTAYTIAITGPSISFSQNVVSQ